MSYWTIRIGYQKNGATKWHPTDKEGPFSVLTRGAFRSRDEACIWASRELGPGNWEAVEVNNDRRDLVSPSEITLAEIEDDERTATAEVKS